MPVDAAAPGGGGTGGGIHSGTELGLAQRAFHLRGNGPCAVARTVRHLLQPRPSQSATGREKRDGFQQVRLAEPLGPVSTIGPRAETRMRGGVGAELVSARRRTRAAGGRAAAVMWGREQACSHPHGH